MSLYNGPPRPGARGGRDQFNWENVKSDKDREFYLGHSVKASTGRWQKGKDIFWYAREKQDDQAQIVQDELNLVKAREEELMMEALGMKPKSVKVKTQPQLDQKEMKQLLEGRQEDQEEEAEVQNEADPVKGVGFRSGQVFGAGEATQETMAGVGVPRITTNESKPASGQLPPPPRLSAGELLKLQKRQKKDKRRLEKQAKKEAKKEKKEKKQKKKRKRSPSSSGSSHS